MDLLPYEMIEIVGSYDWRSLVMAALTCKSWYEWIRKFPWECVMPIHTSLFDRSYDQMSMFCMLNNSKERSLGNSDCFDNGIVSIYTDYCVGLPYEILPNAFAPKIVDDDLNMFVANKWNFDAVSKMTYPEQRVVTFPERVRKYFLNRQCNVDSDYSFNISFQQRVTREFSDDFFHKYVVLPYTGVCEWRRECDANRKSDLIWLLTRDTLYCVDIAGRKEISAEPLTFDGRKFLGFLNGNTMAMSLADGNVVVMNNTKQEILDKSRLSFDTFVQRDRRSYYLFYEGCRLNINRIEIDAKWLDGLESIADIRSANLQGLIDAEYIDEFLSDKVSEEKPQNPFHSIGYNAGFWNQCGKTTSDSIAMKIQHPEFANEFDEQPTYAGGDSLHVPLYTINETVCEQPDIRMLQIASLVADI
jgi:hypothetical protein